MSAHIKNVRRISIQLREVLPPDALSLSNNTLVSAQLLFADYRATKRGNHLHSGGGQNISIFLPSTKSYTIQWKTMPIVAPFEKFPFTRYCWKDSILKQLTLQRIMKAISFYNWQHNNRKTLVWMLRAKQQKKRNFDYLVKKRYKIKT